MRLWAGFLAGALLAMASLPAAYTTSKISGGGISTSAPPPPVTPPPIDTKLSPNPKKVTRPKPGDIRKKFLAKPGAAIGIVSKDKTTPKETLSGVSPEIAANVQIFAPSDERFVLNETDLRDIIQHELQLCRIKCRLEAPTYSKEPGPQLKLQVFIQPIQEYYAVFMDMRLIEPACPGRVSLKPGEFFQGITWERQASFCTQQYHLTAVVQQRANDMAIAFTTKFLSDQPAAPIPPEAVTRKPTKRKL